MSKFWFFERGNIQGFSPYFVVQFSYRIASWTYCKEDIARYDRAIKSVLKSVCFNCKFWILKNQKIFRAFCPDVFITIFIWNCNLNKFWRDIERSTRLLVINKSLVGKYIFRLNYCNVQMYLLSLEASKSCTYPCTANVFVFCRVTDHSGPQRVALLLGGRTVGEIRSAKNFSTGRSSSSVLTLPLGQTSSQ